MAQASKKQRNTIIASLVAVVLIVSSVTAVIVFIQQSTPAPLILNVSLNQTEVIQGNNLQAGVNVASKGNHENVILGIETNSSSIVCSFEPAKGVSNFTSLLTMNVPDSTPTGNYSVIVTASGGGTIENSSFIVSALSAKVTVSGTLNVLNPVQINFTDLQTNLTLTYQFPLTQSKSSNGYAVLYSPSNSYSITLLNEHTYNVTASDDFTFLWAVFTDTFQAGTLYVYAPAGNSTMQGQNFTVP